MDTLNIALGRADHGLEPRSRSSISDAPHVAELCLKHKSKGVESVYNRHAYRSERRSALQAWADLLAQIEAGRSKVVPIRGVHGSSAR